MLNTLSTKLKTEIGFKEIRRGLPSPYFMSSYVFPYSSSYIEYSENAFVTFLVLESHSSTELYYVPLYCIVENLIFYAT